MPICVCSVPYISDTKIIFFLNILLLNTPDLYKMPMCVCSIPYISDTKLIFFVNTLYILAKYTGPLQNAYKCLFSTIYIGY